MFEKAELVVIAKPVSSEETKERKALEELDSPPGAPIPGDDIKAVGVNTKLATLLVLKGDKSITTFTLHHYTLEVPPGVALVDPPLFVAFDRKEPTNFLFFLIREPDGRYAPVTGQLDPRNSAVSKLDTVAGHDPQ